MALPQLEQTLAIDLELPQEAHEFMIEEEVGPEDVLPALLRLVFWTGYVRGRADTTATLEREIEACGSIS